MTTVSASEYADSIRWKKEDVHGSDSNQNGQAMTQEDFFSLLTTQLAAQDPTKPTDNDQMISQMTNFTMADGISNLQTQFEDLTKQFGSFMESMGSQQTSNKALQASSMVGREVLVPSKEAALFQLDEEGAQFGMAGQVNFDGAYNNLKVEIKDAGGKLLNTLDLGAKSEGGPLTFAWDGKNADGEQLQAGMYKIEAYGNGASGEKEKLATATYSRVDSVRFGSGNELTMNVRNLGSFTMNDILEVAN